MISLFFFRQSEKYQSSRDLDELKQFVQKKAGAAAEVKPDSGATGGDDGDAEEVSVNNAELFLSWYLVRIDKFML